jgi:hypothetical protein
MPRERPAIIASTVTALSEMAAKYWFVLGVGVSYLWFAAGKQSLVKPQRSNRVASPRSDYRVNGVWPLDS